MVPRERWDALVARAGGSQWKLADLLGWRPQTLSAYILGRQRTGRKTLERIINKTGCSLAWLTGEDDPSISPRIGEEAREYKVRARELAKRLRDLVEFIEENWPEDK